MRWARVVRVLLSMWVLLQALADDCVSKVVCGVRRMEGIFSAFQGMEVRMLTAEEVKTVFSCLGLICAWHYMQIMRQQVQTVPYKGIFPEENA